MGMLFVIWLIIYFQRINVSILLVDPIFLTEMDLIGQNSKQGLLMTLFLISYSITNMIASPIGDWIGPRKGMIIALSLASISLLFGGLATGIMGILVARVLLGVGQGIYFPNQSIIIRNWFPPIERGKANAIYAVGGCVGPIIAMPFFVFIVTQYNWQASFYIIAILSFMTLIPLLFNMVSDNPIISKFSTEKEKEFIIREQNDIKVTNKESRFILFKNLLSSLDYWLVCVSFICFTTIWWGLLTWLPKYLVEVRLFDLEALGWVATLPYMLAAVTVILGGVLSDRVGKRAIFGIVAFTGAALSLLVALFVQSNIICLALLTLCGGFSMLYYAPVWALLQSLLPSNLVGTGSGVMNGICNLIGGASPFIIGFLIDLTTHYSIGFSYMVVFGFLGTITCTILLKRSH